ncbi:hypothetical protein, partial [Paenarthrobacter ureafaciens]|uniref:hypothetical protein n=1 Tax=Paenarthrobacter ureafaciens TaxID=37931 RepID=UPI00255478CD
MGLSGQVVVERAGRPGAAAAMDSEAGAGVVRAGLGTTTAAAGREETALGFAAANGGGPPGVGDLPSKYPSGGGGVVEDVMEALEDGAAVLEAARALALPAGRVFDVQEAADLGVSSFLCKGPVGCPVCRVVRSEVGWGIERRKRSVPGASLGCR